MSQAVPVRSSRTQDVYEHLRAELLNGHSEPAARLRINALCRSLGVSLSAVREALSRLTSEGLVIAEPQRGFRVAPVSASELVDLTQVRTPIECQCLERAIALGGLDWEAPLVAAFHRLSRAPERDPANPERMSDAWSAAHAAFHAALVSACDSPWLLKLREVLYVQSERYRRLSIPLAGIARDFNREHQQILDAALARDVRLARTLLTQHLQLTTDSLLVQPLLAAPEARPARPRRLPAASGTIRQVPESPAAGTGDERTVSARSSGRIRAVQKRKAGRELPRLEG